MHNKLRMSTEEKHAHVSQIIFQVHIQSAMRR